VNQHADVIVVGLGAMGSATCLQLAARGARVVGIDQYEPPHPFGSTHGDTRITRLAIGEGAEYVPLVRRSHELWQQLEQRSGLELLTRSGGLVLGPPGSEFLQQTRESARQYGIPHDNLTNAELRDRYPMFAVDDDTEVYHELESGYVRPEEAVRLALALARQEGAELRLGERVEKWTASADGVRVRTPAGAYEAEQLVFCAGPWIMELFPNGGEIFGVYRQVMYWLEITQGYEQLRDMPTFIWDFAGRTEGVVHLSGIYGFPAVDGPRGGVKVGTESYRATTAPDGRQHPASGREVEQFHARYIAPHLPWLGPRVLRSVSCLYTSTNGSRFVIDRHPGHENVLIVSACSGHGFKHSPAIGEAVAQLMTDGDSAIDLGHFSLAAARRQREPTGS
jgi:sarcosine oxidase